MQWSDSLAFAGRGFGIVMVVLALLWLVNAALGRLFVRLSGDREAVTRFAPAAPNRSGGPPPQHIAAISAAVAVLTEGRGRVVAVRAAPHVAAAWAQEGRIEQFSSHRVRWDWAVPGPPHVDHEGIVHGVPAPGYGPDRAPAPPPPTTPPPTATPSTATPSTATPPTKRDP